jgi:hypothetical protein
MLKKALLVLAVGVLTVALTGVPAMATPDGPQRLRGMEDRTFLVEVSLLDGSFLFDNCYTFNADGTWFDLVLTGIGGFENAIGEWEQDSNGVSTTFSVEADLTPFGAGGSLIQNGAVTPAMGTGVLQLSAIITIPAGVVGPELMVSSVGSEVESCPL